MVILFSAMVLALPPKQLCLATLSRELWAVSSVVSWAPLARSSSPTALVMVSFFSTALYERFTIFQTVSDGSASIFSTPAEPSSDYRVLVVSPADIVDLTLSLCVFSTGYLASSNFTVPFVVVSTGPRVSIGKIFGSYRAFTMGSQHGYSPFSHSIASEAAVATPAVFSPLAAKFTGALWVLSYVFVIGSPYLPRDTTFATTSGHSL